MSAAVPADTDLINLTASAAIALMRSGDLGAERYAQALLDRAQQLGRLNAFRTLSRDRVLEAARAADKARLSGAARGLLHGLPLPVKDSVNTREAPTSNGASALARFRPREDAAVLAPLFEQGAILMGKTNIHELSRGWTSNNFAFGAVLNPYNLGHIPGGSSGGSAAAVAARMAPVALAEDTLGSIRIPASLCGLAGLRPTYARYPGDGIMPLTLDKFDQAGPLARCVTDLVLFDAAVTGDTRPLSPPDLHGVRIGVAPAYFLSALDPEVERVMSEVFARLTDAGATLVKADIPEPMVEAPTIVATVIACENRASISAFLEKHQAGVTFEEVLAQASPLLQSAYQSLAPPREAYETALARRETLKAATREYFHAHGIAALAFPSALAPAPPLGDNLEFQIRGERVSIRTVMSRNTAIGSAASLCSLVLPGGLSSLGLPIGVEFAALPGHDRQLLSLGLSLEKALGPIPAPIL
jgi:Asp-tRNA(Asn)/Glu-tRNA(Gln) amidotransferase A subunit family amidase